MINSHCKYHFISKDYFIILIKPITTRVGNLCFCLAYKGFPLYRVSSKLISNSNWLFYFNHFIQ
nr:MAG TPA: hypothetical protein [Caudoviricetes sp.]